MKEPTYNQAIYQAWKLVWHNKVLWILGLLSVFVGQFGLGDFAGRLMLWSDKINTSQSWLDMQVYFSSWYNISSSEVVALVFLGIILLGLLVVVVFMSITAQGALIVATADYFGKKKLDSISKAWYKSTGHFWRLFILNILQKALLCIVLLAVIAFWLWLVSLNTVGGVLLTTLVTLVGFLLAFIVSAVFIYSAGYVLTDNDSVLDAVRKGWKIFTSHILVSFELSVLLLLAGIVLMSVVIVGSVLLMFVSALIWMFGAITGYDGLLWFGMAVYTALFVVFVAWAGAVFNAFTTSSWIYLFMHMKKSGFKSRLKNMFRKLFKR